MGEVTVSVKLTQKQAGALYMKSLKQADRIDHMKAALRRIVMLAEQNPSSSNWEIVTAAKAGLELPSTGVQTK